MKRQNFAFAPFAYSQISLTKKHIIILTLLAIQMILFFLQKDFRIMLNIAVNLFAILSVSFIAGKINNSKNWFDIALITEAVLIAFCIPMNYNPLILFCLVATSYFFIKIMFGGFGANIFSTVACTVAILYISFPASFPQSLNDVTLLKSHGNMLSTLQISGAIKNDKTITSLLNYIFGNIGVIIPEGYANMLLQNVSTIPALRYNLLTLISAAILFAHDVGDKIISVTFIVGYGLFVWTFAMNQIDGSFFSGDVLSAFCTGGIFFYAFFVAGESSTLPHTKAGKIIYGLILSAVTFIICGPGGFPAGAALAIVAANICSPLILYIESKFFSRSLRKLYGKVA